MYRKILENYANHSIKNTRGEACGENDMTVCCPHMSVNQQGEYSATNEMTPFLYKGNTYELHTCCKICAVAMSKYGDTTFENIHKPIVHSNHMMIHHKDTGVVVQKMKLIGENYTEHSTNKYNELKINNELMWEFSQPTSVYNDMVSRFGLPDVLGPQRGGIAIWNNIIGHHDTLYNEKNVFDKIELRDELVAHACPAQHNDFLYSYIKIPILPDQLEDVLQLSGSVNYDGLKHELSARCANTCANVMTLYLATEIVLSHIDPSNHHHIEKIHNEKMYGEHINKSGDGLFTKNIYKKLASNIEKIKKSQKLPRDYWTGAFSDNCEKPN